MKQFVLASLNAKKVHELKQLLSDYSIDVLSQADFQLSEIEETGITFVENALIKARHASQATGLPALADDSGLVVPALHGAPGIYSARYAGVDSSDRDNIDKLLIEMADLDGQDRRAYFTCTLVYLEHANDPTPLIASAEWHGSILKAPHGHQGFGYDPVFYIPEFDCAAAMLEPMIKNSHSHRGKALQHFLTQFQNRYLSTSSE